MEGQRKENQVSKKTIACLFALLLVSCLVIFKDFLFGDRILAYTDIGSDTYDQYLMFYQSVINHIRSGNFSLWDFTNGLGTNMFVMNLFDPFLLVMYLWGVIFGPQQIYGFIVYWMILHILLAGFVIYLFLSNFRLSERAKLFASYIYALCGFMVVWGQHYQFGTMMVMLPLLLWAVENSFRKTSGYLKITIVCAVACFSSVYTSYMQLLVLGFYVLFRVAWEEKLFSAAGIKRVGKIYGSMILGIGMALMQLLPSAYVIFGVSSRVSGNEGSFVERMFRMLTVYPQKYYETLFHRLFSSNLLGVSPVDYKGYTNYYEDPNIFLSALFVIALFQFVYLWFTKSFNKKQKFLLALAGILFAFVIFIPMGSAIFNGFAYPFSRYTFICMPFGVWMIAYVLHKIWEEKKYQFLLLALSMLAVMYGYGSMYLADGKRLALLLAVLAVGIGSSLALYMVCKNRMVRELSVLALLGCVILTMSCDAYFSYSYYRNTLYKQGSDYLNELYDKDVEQALAYLEEIDQSFYRVEKDYTVGTETSCLNSMAQNYRGISTYNSTLNGNVAEFFANIWPSAMIVNNAHYSFANAVNEDLAASLSHVKYVLSKNEDFSAVGYELLRQIGDIYIYQNQNTQDIGKFYTETITSKEYQQIALQGDKQQVLSKYLVCDSVEDLHADVSDLAVVDSTLIANLDDTMLVTSEERKLALDLKNVSRSSDKKYIVEFDISYVGGSGYVELYLGNGKSLLNVTSVPTRMQFTLPENAEEILMITHLPVEQAVVSNACVYECELTNLSELSTNIEFQNSTNDGKMLGECTVEEKGILMFAIPYEDGWHAYVNGEEQEIHKVNFGFSGIVLEEGTYSIELVYKCPGFVLGVLASLLFLGMTIAVWSYVYKKCNKKLLFTATVPRGVFGQNARKSRELQRQTTILS